MLSHLTEYHRPTSLEETLRLLARTDVATVPLAGGTRLIPTGMPGVQAAVDLRNLALNTIESTGSGLHLGAMVTLQAVIDNPRSGTFAGGVLAEAARRSAARNVRNVTTLGGTVATADPLDELLLALLVLDAQVTLARATSRHHLPLVDFLGDPAGHLPRGTLIVEIVIPFLPRNFGVGLERVARTPADCPIVAAAAMLGVVAEKCLHVRLALAGVSERPARLTAAEAILADKTLNARVLSEVVETVRSVVNPPTDFRAGANYRREMAGVVARRALQRAWEQASAGGVR